MKLQFESMHDARRHWELLDLSHAVTGRHAGGQQLFEISRSEGSKTLPDGLQ